MAVAPPSYAEILGAPLATLTALHAPAPFAVVRVHGPDAVDFLHRLSTQDVAGMADGEVCPAAFLTPKGKLETVATLARSGDAVWVEVQQQDAERLAALLERYHFTERLAIHAPTDWQCVQLVGPQAWQRVGARGFEATGDLVSLASARRGLQWVRWHGSPARLPARSEVALTPAQWQALRIAAGVAWVGVDVDGGNLGLEADIDDCVSLTKGCYTGQEIVARIHTYGHVNRRLARVRTGPGELPAVGCELRDEDGEPVGRLTSLAPTGAAGAVGLAMLPHELTAPGTRLTAGGVAVEVV